MVLRGLQNGFIFNQTELNLFVEHNQECDAEGLIEWIAELLPQQSF